MTHADLSLLAFAACNVLRIVAYVPQMIRLARHPDAAVSFSYASWVLFTIANLSTAVYAGVMLGDAMLGAVHVVSALCCAALIGLALWRCRTPQPSALQRSGRPAARRSVRKAEAHGSTRIAGIRSRTRSMLRNAVVRTTDRKRCASCSRPNLRAATAAAR